MRKILKIISHQIWNLKDYLSNVCERNIFHKIIKINIKNSLSMLKIEYEQNKNSLIKNLKTYQDIEFKKWEYLYECVH